MKLEEEPLLTDWAEELLLELGFINHKSVFTVRRRTPGHLGKVNMTVRPRVVTSWALESMKLCKLRFMNFSNSSSSSKSFKSLWTKPFLHSG